MMKINPFFLMKSVIYFLIFLLVAILFYAASGYISARNDASELRNIAQEMIDIGQGADALGNSIEGKNRSSFIIKIEDPNFYNHNGIDFKTLGAGYTTITQSLAKRLAFKEYRFIYQKIRQTGYAMGLETVLSKDEIFTLYLNTVHMGRFPTGWIEGFHRASKLQYRENVADISDDEFIELLSVMIAPGELRLDQVSAKRDERVRRIKKLLENGCTPTSHNDIWLEGCA